MTVSDYDIIIISGEENKRRKGVKPCCCNGGGAFTMPWEGRWHSDNEKRNSFNNSSTKSEPEKTDVEVKLNKPVLNVKVNDKDFTVAKAENEQYLFDKNKLTLTQSSSTDLNIKIPVVDKTRRWGIGAGISKDGAVGIISFPLKGSVGGWVAGRADNVMGGVMVRF